MAAFLLYRHQMGTAFASEPCSGNWMPPLQHCLTRRLARTLPVYSLRGQLRLNSLWNPRCSVCCFCVGSVCRSRSQHLGAGATSRMMFRKSHCSLPHVWCFALTWRPA